MNTKLFFRTLIFIGCLFLVIILHNDRFDFPYLWIITRFLTFMIFLIGLNLLITILTYIYRKRNDLAPTQQDNITIGVYNIYLLIITGASILFILSFWGIDFVSLFTTLSIVAAAIAIVSKEYISMIISGFIITFSKVLNIDDYVKINEHKGKIINLNLTKVALLNEDDDLVYLPNDKVYSSEFINYTKSRIGKINIGFEIPPVDFDNVEQLESGLSQELAEYQNFILPDSFVLKIVAIKKDIIEFKFQLQLQQHNRQLEREIRRNIVRYVVNLRAQLNADPEE